MAERFKFISAVHLFLRDDNKILLLRRFNTGYEDGNYSVVAGHLDGKESVFDGMIREAREEAGIQILKEDLAVVHVMHRISNDLSERIDFFLECRSWKGKIQNLEPEKCDELRWVELENLPQNVIPYISFAIQNVNQGLIFSEFNI